MKIQKKLIRYADALLATLEEVILADEVLPDDLRFRVKRLEKTIQGLGYRFRSPWPPATALDAHARTLKCQKPLMKDLTRRRLAA